MGLINQSDLKETDLQNKCVILIQILNLYLYINIILNMRFPMVHSLGDRSEAVFSGDEIMEKLACWTVNYSEMIWMFLKTLVLTLLLVNLGT